MACDINQVDGNRVDDPTNMTPVQRLQDAFNRQTNICEDLGPYVNTKTDINGILTQLPGMAASHQNHVHVSGQR